MKLCLGARHLLFPSYFFVSFQCSGFKRKSLDPYEASWTISHQSDSSRYVHYPCSCWLTSVRYIQRLYKSLLPRKSAWDCYSLWFKIFNRYNQSVASLRATCNFFFLFFTLKKMFATVHFSSLINFFLCDITNYIWFINYIYLSKEVILC